MSIDEEITYKAGTIVDGMVSNYVPSEICDAYYNGYIDGGKYVKNKLVDMDKKNKDEISLIIKWFEHIEQLATDRKTANGFVMNHQETLNEIRCFAKIGKEYMECL